MISASKKIYPQQSLAGLNYTNILDTIIQVLVYRRLKLVSTSVDLSQQRSLCVYERRYA